MCYIVAKKRFNQGCIAMKTNRGKELSSFVNKLNKKTSGKNIQIITISRPSAYREYAPYRFVDNEQIFESEIDNF